MIHVEHESHSAPATILPADVELLRADIERLQIEVADLRADHDDVADVVMSGIEQWGRSISSFARLNDWLLPSLAACAARSANDPNDDWAAAALAVRLDEEMTRTPGFASFTEEEGDMLGLNKLGPWVEVAKLAYPHVTRARQQWLEIGNTIFFAHEADEHVGTVRSTVAMVLAARRMVTRFTAGAGMDDWAGPEVGS